MYKHMSFNYMVSNTGICLHSMIQTQLRVRMYGKWTLGTQVAKQFGVDGVLTWFEGTYRKYHNDGDQDYYCIVYSDGDSEDLTAFEMQAAVECFKSRRHQQAIEKIQTPLKRWVIRRMAAYYAPGGALAPTDFSQTF
jgi:hypothetical protein